MKPALYIVGGCVVLVAVGFFVAIHTTATTTPVQHADTSIAQYDERPDAPTIVPAAPVPGCALRFSVTPQEPQVSPGGLITYAVTLRNGGTDACADASFSLYYADDESFISSSVHPTASTYYWNVGNLAPGAAFTTSVTTVDAGGTDAIEDDACATADNAPQDVCAENLILVRGVAGAAAKTALVPKGKEFGTWIWTSPVAMAPGYATEALAAAQARGITAVYVTIDDYLSTADAEKPAYEAALASFIRIANGDGIAVDVEGGAQDWAEPQNRWKGYALIDFVSAYNDAHPDAMIRRFQYDVEPYLLPEYATEPASVLDDFVTFIDASAARMKNINAGFTVVIPHFYDSEQQWTPSFVYDGTNAYAYTHLLQVLEQKPGSEMIVMAYRNFLTGDNGTEQISHAEVAESESGGYHTSIIVAQETGAVTPAYVTFKGFSLSQFLAAVSGIYAFYADDPAFAGVAVHYLDTFLALN